MQLTALRQHLATLGAQPAHTARLLRHWLTNRPHTAARRQPEHHFPKAVLAALPALDAQWHALARLDSRHAGPDGERWLVRLSDDQLVETVLLPRGGVCVSSQIGCAVGCGFCMTGRSGLLRQLSSGEIVAQVALARQAHAVRKVVFMGMGEPAHNLDAVLEAIEALGDSGGLAHKQLVLSTVGDARVFDRLPRAAVKPALALSLHTADDALRAELLPNAPRIPVAELVAAADAYARATGYPVQYQATLLAGVNDDEASIDALAALLRGRHGLMNLILYNPDDALPYSRPDPTHAQALARRLHGQGVLTKLRISAAQAVQGGCGQLRAHATPMAPRSAHPVRVWR